MTVPFSARTVGLAMFGAMFALCTMVGCNRPNSQPDSGFGVKPEKDDTWPAGLDKRPTPKTLYALARVLGSQGRQAQAVVVLQRILRESPSFLPAYVELASVYMRQQQHGSAVQVLEAGLKIAPDDPVMLNDLGVAYLAIDRPDKALQAFERTVKVVPDKPRYQSNLALSLAMLGRYEEALVAYERIIPPAEAHYNVAVVCESRADKERAAQEYARALMLRMAKTPAHACRFHNRPPVAEAVPHEPGAGATARASSPVATAHSESSAAALSLAVAVGQAVETPAAAMAPAAAPADEPAAGTASPSAESASPVAQAFVAADVQSEPFPQTQPAAAWEASESPDVSELLHGIEFLKPLQLQNAPEPANQ